MIFRIIFFLFTFFALPCPAWCTEYSNDIFRQLNLPQDQLTKINDFIDGEERYCSWVAEYPVITNLINEMHLKVGCEVGVAYGGQSKYFLEHTNLEKLYSVDPYKTFKKNEYDDFLNFEQNMHNVLFLRVQNKLAPFGNRSLLMRNTSEEAVVQFANQSLDFVYIDANHAYEYVRQDINLWFPKVKVGGLISGDDYKVWPGVSKAVIEFTQARNIKLNVKDNKWWFVKP